MRTTYTRTWLLLVWLSLHTCMLVSQSRYDTQGLVRRQLLNLISAKFGPELNQVGFSIMDTLIDHSLVENDRIRDPYHTLRGCVLFSAYKDDGKNEPNNFIVGMARGGKIIWDNAPGSSANLGGDLEYAQDINNDGEVDLLVTEYDREQSLQSGPRLAYLYILSWDGTRGRFINAFEDEGGSALIGSGFGLGGKDWRGAKQIVTSLPNLDIEWADYRTKTFPQVTYAWNGKLYGLWLDAKRQIRGHYGIPSLPDTTKK